MTSTNQSPFYKKAESNFIQAKTNEDKMKWLEEMIRECPKHKSSEKMLANLKTRYIKLKDKIEKLQKRSKVKRAGIKKEDLQAVIIGLTNTGKSSLLSLITNTKPTIAQYNFTTKHPKIGMADYKGTKIQMIEVPAYESEYYDRGIVNTGDVVLILITNLSQIEKILPNLNKVLGKKIIVFNKKETINEKEIRKISATLSSKKHDFLIISTKTSEGIQELKEKLFNSFGKIRVFTKEPGKAKSNNPLILEQKSVVKDVAKKILKEMSMLKNTRIWGPSSKFPGQIVGLQHKLKDMDILEFKTR